MSAANIEFKSLSSYFMHFSFQSAAAATAAVVVVACADAFQRGFASGAKRKVPTTFSLGNHELGRQTQRKKLYL